MRPPPSPRPSWQIAEVAGHPCEIYTPPDPLLGRAAIYLHGVGEPWLQGLPSLRDRVERERLPVIAPQTGRSWWLDRVVSSFDLKLTPERYVVEKVVAEVGQRFGVAPPGIALVGSGMGGQGALRLAYRHPGTFPVSAAISPAIDFHTAMREAHERDDGELFDTLWEIYGDIERARQDTAILHVHPLNWPRHQFFASDMLDEHWYDGAERLKSKLIALGIPHVALLEAHGTSGDGQGQTSFNQVATAAAMAFILERLDQESRRIA